MDKNYIKENYTDSRILNKYFALLNQNDESMIQIAFNGLKKESNIKVYPNDNYLEKLRDATFNSKKEGY